MPLLNSQDLIRSFPQTIYSEDLRIAVQAVSRNRVPAPHLLLLVGPSQYRRFIFAYLQHKDQPDSDLWSLISGKNAAQGRKVWQNLQEFDFEELLESFFLYLSSVTEFPENQNEIVMLLRSLSLPLAAAAGEPETFRYSALERRRSNDPDFQTSPERLSIPEPGLPKTPQAKRILREIQEDMGFNYRRIDGSATLSPSTGRRRGHQT